ncbi:hypothetical protein ACMU_00205 [Actibacterium mucosum KCTC 23349]|uniref:Uncharacterized protein n=1 Tax=Actibacterium mucosum KCTC 23349 TaxID=1454373 RepID=A0A037ZQ49_9RHOB|nr:hypothetical protein [Actibacterium mucosum]KAJ56947.1 hypothetical protein ACMU_00205 [Actibacterium mucosum KCTC 23349]
MSEFLPKEVREGLEKARKEAMLKKNRLRVQVGEHSYRILRLWHDGFALDSDDTPMFRGLVDIYDGGRHIYQALIVASAEENGERVFEFKRNTAALDKAPLDFERDENAPIALLPH